MSELEPTPDLPDNISLREVRFPTRMKKPVRGRLEDRWEGARNFGQRVA